MPKRKKTRPKLPKATQKIIVLQGTAHMQCHARVKEIFHVNLSDYWLDNVRGLDIVKFCKEVLHPKPGEDPLATARRKFGKDGADLYKRLRPTMYKPRKQKAE